MMVRSVVAPSGDPLIPGLRSMIWGYPSAAGGKPGAGEQRLPGASSAKLKF